MKKPVTHLPSTFHDMKRQFSRDFKFWTYGNRLLCITVWYKEDTNVFEVAYTVDMTQSLRIWTPADQLLPVMESAWNKALQEVRKVIKDKEHKIKVIQRDINLTRAWLGYVTGEDQRPPPDFWERLDASE